MFSLTERHRYYLYARPTDMRKGFNGWSGLVRNKMGRNPLSGDVYLFINRSRNRMKLLVWESGGFVLYYKRLEQGTFEYPESITNHQSATINWQQLLLIVKGIRLSSIEQRKRFGLKKLHKK